MIITEASPHRVFVSRVGRVEVYQPIPPVHGRSPTGPHTHLLLDLLRHRRTHAATEAIPAGFVPCAHIYPAHPAKDAIGYPKSFNQADFAAVEAILQEFGDARFTRLKDEVREAVAAGALPSDLQVNGRFARTIIRVALRQMRASNADWPALEHWLATFDHASVRLDEGGRDIHHR